MLADLAKTVTTNLTFSCCLQPYLMLGSLIYCPAGKDKHSFFQHAVHNYDGLTYIFGLTLHDQSQLEGKTSIAAQTACAA